MAKNKSFSSKMKMKSESFGCLKIALKRKKATKYHFMKIRAGSLNQLLRQLPMPLLVLPKNLDL